MIYIVPLVLFIFIYLLNIYLRKLYFNKLVTKLDLKAFNEFDKMLNSFATTLLVKPFIIDILRLNRAILANDEVMMASILSSLEDKNLKEYERIEVYFKAYQYYVLLKDDTKAKKYYKLLRDYNNPEVNKMIEEIK